MATFGFSAGAFTLVGPGLFRVDFKKGFSEARFATGSEKAVFEIFYCMLTTLGSVASDPLFGCLIPKMIGQFAVNNQSGIQDFVVSEFNRIENTIKAKQAGQGLPDDQLLDQLMAESITMLPAEQAIEITMVIRTVDGTSIGFIIPFTVGR